ncbi:hypothetical protein AVEN_36921-1 [Araneus ventricosus]|uniref:Uncharacterized protein n=1 Tax=Araneus ventricosus TaxID=182803 RepID=A0A4Y2GA74_ARAVE|nr:hypothetical protein AVEN_36921-1 [Araneus ventricosus]
MDDFNNLNWINIRLFTFKSFWIALCNDAQKTISFMYDFYQMDGLPFLNRNRYYTIGKKDCVAKCQQGYSTLGVVIKELYHAAYAILTPCRSMAPIHN